MRQSGAGVIGAIALAVLSTACASTGAVPKPFPTAGSPPRREPPPADAGSPTAAPRPGRVDTYALVGTALDLRGTPYRNGGADPQGFDCSGFTHYVFTRHGVTLPRAVRDQFLFGKKVDPDDLQEGDLLFFATDGRGASHVGIAVGGDAFVHAPSSTGAVRVERLSSRYWAQRFVGARRAYR